MISALNIQRSLSSLLLIVALLGPSAVQFAHAFEGHDHPICNDFSTHIHEEQLDCSLCDFQVSVFDFTPETFDYPVSSVTYFKSVFGTVEISYTLHTRFTSPRGPPVLV